MRTTTATLSLLSSLLAISTAQSTLSLSDIPKCAQQCFTTAISNSSCGLLDAYCQCTTGAKQIRADTISCLCQSTCTATDLAKVQQVSNSLCSAALSASSESYTPVTAGLDVCQATGAAGSGSGSATTTGSGANASGGSGGSGTQSASASASGSAESQSGNAAAPAVTGMAGFQCALMGAVGLGVMVL